MPNSILIIGHGFIGSELGRQLLAAGHDVTAVNRSESGDSDYPILAGDVSDEASLRSIRDQLSRPPSAIVHCASSGRGGADAYRAVFLDGVDHLHAIFPETPLLITSSTSVYGQTDGTIVVEDSPTEPDRETSRILVEAEEKVRAGGGVALRLAGLYGPGRSIYLKRILAGEATIESGEVSRWVNQAHQADAAGSIVHLLANLTDHEGDCYNVVDDEPITQRDLYTRLAAFFDEPTPPESPPDLNRKRAWTHKFVSNAALRETGWEPIYPTFFDALERDPELVASFRS